MARRLCAAAAGAAWRVSRAATRHHPNLEPIREEQTQRDRLSLGPDQARGSPGAWLCAPRPTAAARRWPIAHRCGQGRAPRPYRRAPSVPIAAAVQGRSPGYSARGWSLGDDHPVVDRIVVEHHRVSEEATDATRLVSGRLSPQLSLSIPSPVSWALPSWARWWVPTEAGGPDGAAPPAPSAGSHRPHRTSHRLPQAW